MFTLLDRGLAHDCQGYRRREFLRVGSLALGGLTLPALLAARSQAGAITNTLATGRSVVFLYLQGGPSHIELFDPKMTAPEEIRSVTGELRTSLPGITFGGTFPKLAALAHKFSVVRSFASGNSDHQRLYSVAAPNPMQAAFGSLYSRVVGPINGQTGVPTNVFVPPEAVAGKDVKFGSNFETKALPQLLSAGRLGEAYNAFDPSGGGELRKNLELKLPRERFNDRQLLLGQIDNFKRQLDATRAFDALDNYQQQAYQISLRGIAEAFDLKQEDAGTVARYDTTKVFKLEEIQKWGDMRRSSNLLGQQMLLARRLCEAGCGFVTVSDSGWDMHSNGNSPKNLEGMQALGRQVDHAVAAFIEDIEARGLRDRILLVVSGEMGRTPRINKNGGRDHYANLTPLLLYGGGLKMGHVVGQSDAGAAQPATEKYTPAHLMATVMHSLFHVGEVRVDRDLPKNVVQTITENKPIAELV